MKLLNTFPKKMKITKTKKVHYFSYGFLDKSPQEFYRVETDGLNNLEIEKINNSNSNYSISFESRKGNYVSAIAEIQFKDWGCTEIPSVKEISAEEFKKQKEEVIKLIQQ